ncbi:hypothetical protein D3C73_1629810 [compost metagenome]
MVTGTMPINISLIHLGIRPYPHLLRLTWQNDKLGRFPFAESDIDIVRIHVGISFDTRLFLFHLLNCR